MQTESKGGVGFLDTLFGHMNLEVTASGGDRRGEYYVYALEGQTTPLKRRPDVMTALTLITSLAASNATGERRQCVLDLEGGFEARLNLLREAADDLGLAVAKSGRRAVVEGLDNTERKVMHHVLTDDPKVQTRSDGEGDQRFLLIEPA